MWHQARKQEKKLRCLMVDYKKRAERRRNYYELCKKDPCSFLRFQGSNMRIHIDPAVAAAAEGPRTMMGWNGDEDNLIDRFDVRAHMDHIPDYKSGCNLPDALEVEDDMKCNYDRYRIIVQNDCARISEEAALRQIEVDEKYGDVSKNVEQEEKKKSLAGKKAAIGFSYDTPEPSHNKDKGDESEVEEEEENFEDVDLDIAFDIDQINVELKQQLDVVAITYGMAIGEFAEQLTKDKEDEKELREAKVAEQEKAAMSGRKSRKERRMYKETMLRLRGASPPKYRPPDQQPRGSPSYGSRSGADSDSSRSASPVGDGLDFITNLGDGDSFEPSNTRTSADNLPPHLRLGGNSSAASWKQRRMRSESPQFHPEAHDSTNVKKQLSPPPPARRYRRASLEKSDHSDLSSDEEKANRQHSYKLSTNDGKDTSKPYAASKPSATGGGSKHTAQERLKRKMKSAINRTYKEDKKTIEVKKDQARKEQQERTQDIRHQMDELRRKDFVRNRLSSSPSRSRSPEKPADHRYQRDYHGGSRKDDRPSFSEYGGPARGGNRHSDSREYKDRHPDTDRHASNRESRDRYRDSHRHRSHSRSPARRRNYR